MSLNDSVSPFPTFSESHASMYALVAAKFRVCSFRLSAAFYESGKPKRSTEDSILPTQGNQTWSMWMYKLLSSWVHVHLVQVPSQRWITPSVVRMLAPQASREIVRPLAGFNADTSARVWLKIFKFSGDSCHPYPLLWLEWRDCRRIGMSAHDLVQTVIARSVLEVSKSPPTVFEQSDVELSSPREAVSQGGSGSPLNNCAYSTIHFHNVRLIAHWIPPFSSMHILLQHSSHFPIATTQIVEPPSQARTENGRLIMHARLTVRFIWRSVTRTGHWLLIAKSMQEVDKHYLHRRSLPLLSSRTAPPKQNFLRNRVEAIPEFWRTLGRIGGRIWTRRSGDSTGIWQFRRPRNLLWSAWQIFWTMRRGECDGWSYSGAARTSGGCIVLQVKEGSNPFRADWLRSIQHQHPFDESSAIQGSPTAWAKSRTGKRQRPFGPEHHDNEATVLGLTAPPQLHKE